MDLRDIYDHQLTPKSIHALEDFMSLIDVSRFSKNLRNLLLQYLINESDELLPDFEHFIEDMKFLFDFLDQLEGTK